MRRACIDIGSNTTRLLVAECAPPELEALHEERSFTRIGEALGVDGAIGPAKLDEVVGVVRRQLAVARELGAPAIRCIATASVRRAANGEELRERLARDCSGLELEILSPAQEARLAFIGVAALLHRDPGGPLAVVDVGGGSSELVIGSRPDRVAWWRSWPLGSSDLARECLRSDPPSTAELELAQATVRAALRGVSPPPSSLTVAVGGSATSLRRLAGALLDRRAIAAARGELSAARAGEVADRHGLEPERVRLLPGALLILDGISELLRAPLLVARGGVREGALLDQGP